MRVCPLGAILAIVFSAAAGAQPTGEVESIGFGGGLYRPGCWTPMVVRIKPNNAPSGTYQIQVRQRDQDNDVAVFTRKITITASSAGGAREQRFSMLFIPQPVNTIPDAVAGGTLKDLQERLEVYICTEAGRQIAQLQHTQQPDDLDMPPRGRDDSRGTRLVLCVSETGARPPTDEYTAGLDQPDKLLGVLEDIVFVPQRPRELPESALAYDAVDAVVWLDGDATQLQSDAGHRMSALRAWIAQGGHLIISQERNWQQTKAGFAELLPVTLEGMALRDTPEPLRSIALSRRASAVTLERWEQATGPFACAVAEPREGALVENWIEFGPPTGRRPFIARRGFGCGVVTWVGQDLADPALVARVRSGWAQVWTRILDLRDQPVAGDAATPADLQNYPPASGVDLGPSLLRGLQSGARVGMFITLAIVFFVGYWLVAGPGSFLLLARRGQTQYSWFAFAAVAVAATLLTVLVVRLVLRGPPELRHVTLIRGDRGEEGVIRSRFGLYIPRDGEQRLELASAGGAGNVSALYPLPVHPMHLRDRELRSLGNLSYEVPIGDGSGGGPYALAVPYRSSVKEFESRWHGKLPGRIEGVARIDPNIRRDIDGRLTNGTGVDLRDVYIAYKTFRGERSEDYLLYLPEWKAGVTIDLLVETTQRGPDGGITSAVGINPGDVPHNGRVLWGDLGREWQEFWVRDLRGLTALGQAMWTDDTRSPRAIPMLTFFSRLPAVRVAADGRARIELLRRGARHMDMSGALAAGNLVVLAEGVGPIPSPLTVDGEALRRDDRNTGRIIYQFALPVLRKPAELEPATVPTEPGVERGGGRPGP